MLYNNDYILRQIELLGKGVRVLAGVEEAGYGEELIAENGEVSGELFLLYRLRQLLAENRINEAEDLLFENLERQPTDAYAAVAAEFYAEVQKLSDAQLEQAGFSREEIAQGLADAGRLCHKESEKGLNTVHTTPPNS